MVFSGEWAFGPSFITIANWFPLAGAWSGWCFLEYLHLTSVVVLLHRLLCRFALLGSEHWQSASYIVPACVAIIFAVIVLILGKGSPHQEGLPSLEEMMPEEKSS